MLPPIAQRARIENSTSHLPQVTLFNSGNKSKPEVRISSCENNDFYNKGNYGNAERTIRWCFWHAELFNKRRLVVKKDGVG